LEVADDGAGMVGDVRQGGGSELLTTLATALGATRTTTPGPGTRIRYRITTFVRT
jgi:hypothetical protein